jgi:hypothetical protein
MSPRSGVPTILSAVAPPENRRRGRKIARNIREFRDHGAAPIGASFALQPIVHLFVRL